MNSIQIFSYSTALYARRLSETVLRGPHLLGAPIDRLQYLRQQVTDAEQNLIRDVKVNLIHNPRSFDRPLYGPVSRLRPSLDQLLSAIDDERVIGSSALERLELFGPFEQSQMIAFAIWDELLMLSNTFTRYVPIKTRALIYRSLNDWLHKSMPTSSVRGSQSSLTPYPTTARDFDTAMNLWSKHREQNTGLLQLVPIVVHIVKRGERLEHVLTKDCYQALRTARDENNRCRPYGMLNYVPDEIFLPVLALMGFPERVTVLYLQKIHLALESIEVPSATPPYMSDVTAPIYPVDIVEQPLNTIPKNDLSNSLAADHMIEEIIMSRSEFAAWLLSSLQKARVNHQKLSLASLQRLCDNSVKGASLDLRARTGHLWASRIAEAVSKVIGRRIEDFTLYNHGKLIGIVAQRDSLRKTKRRGTKSDPEMEKLCAGITNVHIRD